MSVDVLEHSPPIEGVILVVALGHHLEARLDEGSPGEVPRGLRLAHVVAETPGQLDRPGDQVTGQALSSSSRVDGQHLESRQNVVVKQSITLTRLQIEGRLYVVVVEDVPGPPLDLV